MISLVLLISLETWIQLKMLKSLWGKITGEDKKESYPDQQASVLNQLADYTIVLPHGYNVNLPQDSLIKTICNGVALSVNAKRSTDLEQGELAIEHPTTLTRIVFRNDKNLEIQIKNNLIMSIDNDATITIEGNVTLNVTGDIDTTSNATTLQADSSVDVDSPVTNLGSGGNAIARVGDQVEVTVTAGSSAGTYTGTIISGGMNTSI